MFLEETGMLAAQVGARRSATGQYFLRVSGDYLLKGYGFSPYGKIPDFDLGL